MAGRPYATRHAHYVGEAVTIRYDSRDMGDVRVFYQNRFLRRAISLEHAAAVRAHRYIGLCFGPAGVGLNKLRSAKRMIDIGLMLVGMPGMEMRMARFPQLYSRVGFAHHYRPLQGDELTFVLTRHGRKLGLNLDAADFSDSRAIASIARITGGNFRLLHRLFVQIERILKINKMTFVTDPVVNAARNTLVIGAT